MIVYMRKKKRYHRNASAKREILYSFRFTAEINRFIKNKSVIRLTNDVEIEYKNCLLKKQRN